MFYVYWIFANIEDDIYKDGYVGITNNLSSRFSKHGKRFGGLYYQIIFTGNMEQAFALEKLLRPKPNIGLNKAIGGLQFGKYSPMTGMKFTDEHKEKLRISNLGKKKPSREWFRHSQETKEKLKIIFKGRKQTQSAKDKVSEALRKRVRKKESYDKMAEKIRESAKLRQNSLKVNGRQIFLNE